MELYRKYPVIVTLWAFMEVVLFAGVIFGWGSLVFILKEEGFYLDSCTESDLNPDKILPEVVPPVTVSNHSLVEKTYALIPLDRNVTGSGTTSVNKSTSWEGCPAQESQLNLWFSIAVSFMYLSFAGIGYLIRHFGTKFTRTIFL